MNSEKNGIEKNIFVVFFSLCGHICVYIYKFPQSALILLFLKMSGFQKQCKIMSFKRDIYQMLDFFFFFFFSSAKDICNVNCTEKPNDVSDLSNSTSLTHLSLLLIHFQDCSLEVGSIYWIDNFVSVASQHTGQSNNSWEERIFFSLTIK